MPSEQYWQRSFDMSERCSTQKGEFNPAITGGLEKAENF